MVKFDTKVLEKYTVCHGGVSDHDQLGEEEKRERERKRGERKREREREREREFRSNICNLCLQKLSFCSGVYFLGIFHLIFLVLILPYRFSTNSAERGPCTFRSLIAVGERRDALFKIMECRKLCRECRELESRYER